MTNKPSVVERRIEEQVVAGRRVGRHVKHDSRSLNYPAEAASRVVDVKHEARGLPLNQGDTSACTGNAVCAALNSTPDFEASGRKILTEDDAIALYTRETADEGEPYPENDPGGTGVDVCKAGVELGWLKGYQHAFGLQHALLALVNRPVITGVDWYDSFDSPDADGLIQLTPGAQVRGGHEFCVDQIIVAKKQVGCWQSWGADWGLGGRFFMSWGLWSYLLNHQGDVTVPIPV